MIIEKSRKLRLAEHPVLQTERLILRPITLADTKDMYEYASDEETVAYVFPLHTSLEDTRRNIAEYFLNEPLGKYAMVLLTENKMIGTIDIRLTEEHNKGEIGYTLNKKYWGQGYASEAAKELVCLSFEVLNLDRIEAIHDLENPKSGRVMEKIGMKKEGIIRNSRFFKGKTVTDVLYGMTKEDYEGCKK